MKIQTLLIILAFSLPLFSVNVLAKAHPKHCDLHKTASTHDCAKHCAQHPGAKDKACAKHCESDTAAKAHICNTPHCDKHLAVAAKSCNAVSCSSHKGAAAHNCSAEHCATHGGNMADCCGTTQRCDVQENRSPNLGNTVFNPHRGFYQATAAALWQDFATIRIN